MREELRAILERVALVVIRFIATLTVSAVLYVADIALKALLVLAVDETTEFYQIAVYVMDVGLIGSAVVVSVCGAVMAAWEALTSALNFIRGKDGKR